MSPAATLDPVSDPSWAAATQKGFKVGQRVSFEKNGLWEITAMEPKCIVIKDLSELIFDGSAPKSKAVAYESSGSLTILKQSHAPMVIDTMGALADIHNKHIAGEVIRAQAFTVLNTLATTKCMDADLILCTDVTGQRQIRVKKALKKGELQMCPLALTLSSLTFLDSSTMKTTHSTTIMQKNINGSPVKLLIGSPPQLAREIAKRGHKSTFCSFSEMVNEVARQRTLTSAPENVERRTITSDGWKIPTLTNTTKLNQYDTLVFYRDQEVTQVGPPAKKAKN